MQYYLDITLLPDSEITLGFLWQKVYQQVHIAFAENKMADNNSAIALSIPNYGDKTYPLGNKLRLFSPTQERLDKLSITTWLKRFTDYTHITSIKAVPESVNKYACFSRKQFTTNLSRLARRRAKRHGESFEQALQYYSNFEDVKTKLPFINVKSLSKGEQFRLFIDCKINEKASEGQYNCYGFSAQATVPWF